MNKKKCIKVFGIQESGMQLLSQDVIEIINKSPVLMGGERQLGFFPQSQGKKLVIKHKLSALTEDLKRENQDAVVLASGDPLFYGIGSYLLSQFANSDYNIEIYPSLSSLQLAAARAGISWQDAKNITLHGRKIYGLAQRVYPEYKVTILTDTENHPGKIAAYLLHYNLTAYRAFLAENLGMQNERTNWYTLEELSEKDSADFLELTVMILIREPSPDDKNQACTGIADELFSYPEKPDGLITKREIRVLSIAALNIKIDSVVWDIGSCTGSVAIESAKIAREGKVFAIEKNPGHMAHCRQNSKRFHTDLELIESSAPEILKELPDPDSVFIGGSGGRLTEILDICISRLQSGGRIVINAATFETLYLAKKHLGDAGFHIDVNMVQISRSRNIGSLTRFEALNPVFILTACREI